MKLIDILVKELPKRGGWPDGVDNISQYGNGELCFNGKDGSCLKSCTGIFLLPHEEGDHTNWAYGIFVTRKQYQAALAASKPEWDGAFPIPAGTEVEVHFDGDDSRVWTHFRVEYMAGDIVVLHDYRIDNVDAYKHNILSFRPIRSEADKKREVAIEEINSLVGDIEKYPTWRDAIAAIYDAGYRKVGE